MAISYQLSATFRLRQLTADSWERDRNAVSGFPPPPRLRRGGSRPTSSANVRRT